MQFLFRMIRRGDTTAKTYLNKLSLFTDKKIWLSFFLYALIVSLFIQLVILPYLLPEWHAGKGLLVGGDWIRFHRFAEEQALEVKELGWGSFSLYPHKQFVAGIASIFYILFIPLPAVVLPLNAVLHASAGLMVFKILSRITHDRSLSFTGAALFIIFPSSLRWVSQLHNDSYAILGALMYLYGWVQLGSFMTERNFRTLLKAVYYLILGVLLVALVRIYLVDVYLVSSLILGLYLILRTIITQEFKSTWVGISLVILLIFTQGLLGEKIFQPQIRLLRNNEALFSDAENQEVLSTKQKKTPRYFKWEESSILPSLLENQVSALILKRNNVIRSWKEGSTTIDAKADLSSSIRILLYTPRALQIALFAPFPSDWLKEGSKLPSNFMKKVAIFETSFVYLLFLFLPFGIKTWRSNTAIHLMLLFCLYFLIVLAIATLNVGNLYRFRYAYFMPLVCLGAASLLKYAHTFKR